MQNKSSQITKPEVAEKIREACIIAAKEGFQQALMSGLCSEGAIEAAIGAMQSLDVKKIIQENSTNMC